MSDEKQGKPNPDELDDDELDLDDEDIELDDDESEEDEDDDSDEEDDSKDDDKDSDDGVDAKTKTILIQKNKYRDRALKAEQELAALKKNQTPPKQKQTKPAQTEEDPFKLERIDFRFDHPDLSTREVNEIETIARARKISLAEAMKTDVARVYLKMVKRKRELAGASNDTGHRTVVRPKGKDPADMTDEEFSALVRKVKAGQVK